MLDDEMPYDKSKDSRAGMCDDYARKTTIKRKNSRCLQKKVRSKVNTEMITQK